MTWPQLRIFTAVIVCEFLILAVRALASLVS